MKKNIGNVLALYPTPAVVVGTEVNGKVNWLLVAHVGIIGHDQIMLSLFKKGDAGTCRLCGLHQWSESGQV